MSRKRCDEKRTVLEQYFRHAVLECCLVALSGSVMWRRREWSGWSGGGQVGACNLSTLSLSGESRYHRAGLDGGLTSLLSCSDNFQQSMGVKIVAMPRMQFSTSWYREHCGARAVLDGGFHVPAIINIKFHINCQGHVTPWRRVAAFSVLVE